MKKINTMQTIGSGNSKECQLTVGLDLGDRFSYYCVLDDTGAVVLEDRLPTTPPAMKQLFGRMLRRRVAMETSGHSPWVSRLLTALGHEVIVAHARNVQLITESRRKRSMRKHWRGWRESIRSC